MLLTALVMGIAGSLHCAGMCSPLALAVTNFSGPHMKNRLLYNSGRITVYGILGALTAGIGYILPMSGFQNTFSLILGLTLILMAINGITHHRIPLFTRFMTNITQTLKAVFSRYIRQKTPGSMILLGGLNGLLPCGLTFLALSLCLTFTTPLEGFIYMIVFGAGTLPVMLGLISVADILRNKMKWDIRKVTTTLMLVSGAVLIARVFLVHIPESHVHGPDFIDIVICR